MKKLIYLLLVSVMALPWACRPNFSPLTPSGLDTATPTSTSGFPVTFTPTQPMDGTSTPTGTSTWPVTLATGSPTQTSTQTMTSSPTFTATRPVTFSPTPITTGTPTTTPTLTSGIPVTMTRTPTSTYTFTYTPTGTATGTATPSATSSATSSAPQTITFTPTATSTTTGGLDITMGNSYSLTTGNYNYTYVHVYQGGALFVNGAVTLTLTDYFSADSGSTVVGNYSTVYETAGSPPFTGLYGPGAGHGGAGGNDGLGNSGGPAYDSPTTPALPGSYGGVGMCGFGMAGGNLISIRVPSGPATLGGTFVFNGYSSVTCGEAPNGPGSGGTIFVMADTIQGNGFLWAPGGSGLVDSSGTGDNSGGAGGGIIVLSTHTVNDFTGLTYVYGGSATAPAQAGQAGIFNKTTF